MERDLLALIVAAIGVGGTVLGTVVGHLLGGRRERQRSERDDAVRGEARRERARDGAMPHIDHIRDQLTAVRERVERSPGDGVDFTTWWSARDLRLLTEIGAIPQADLRSRLRIVAHGLTSPERLVPRWRATTEVAISDAARLGLDAIAAWSRGEDAVDRDLYWDIEKIDDALVLDDIERRQALEGPTGSSTTTGAGRSRPTT